MQHVIVYVSLTHGPILLAAYNYNCRMTVVHVFGRAGPAM